MITLDDPEPRVAVLGDVRESCPLAHTSLAQISNAHHFEVTGVHTTHDPRTRVVTSAGDAEMVAVHAGAVGLGTNVELTVPRLDRSSQAVLGQASRNEHVRDDFEERQTIRSHRSPRKVI
ncbi:MAG TPA: hypothetical protein VIY28_18280 [Pseudonocardiaceae bacterium]